jgi:prepilin-type N-terminal cleavage/methylation domain-containing protein
MKKRSAGFTLVELLLALALLTIITLALFQTLGGSVQGANSINASNDLLREGQIAQQVISARLKEACYIYPAGADLTLAASGYSTRNAFGSPDTEWTVNTHPFVAMILPPDATAGTGQYRFFAYYAMPRSQYVNNAASTINPGRDVRNDNTTWVLMEYSRNITVTGSPTCEVIRQTLNVAGGNAFLLVDYVSPASPITGLFTVDTAATDNNGDPGAAWVEYNLQLQRTTVNGDVIRVGANAGSSNLRGRIYPQNRGQ